MTGPGALIAEYLAGAPVEEELLESARRDPVVLDALADHVDMEMLLAAWGASARGRLFAEEVRARIEAEPSAEAFVGAVRGRIERRRRAFRAALPAAAAALVAAALLVLALPAPDPPRIARAVAAEWDGPSPAGLATGKPADLKAGLAELALARGVTVILEGPARIRLTAPDRVRLERGRLTVRVPPGAEGFRVDTPSSEVVDLGTEFGVSVGADGTSEVHVLEGRIKARRDPEGPYVHLTRGRGLRFDALARKAEEIEGDPGRFVRALPGRSPRSPAYLHWTFDEGEGDVAADSGPGLGGARHPARLRAFEGGEGPLWGEGRFGRALYFNGTDAYATTDFPGIGGADPRTIAFWARVPQDFDRHQGYGMLGWGSMKEPSGAWQISPNPWPQDGPVGRLRIGTHHSFAIGETDLRDGRWHHLAVVMYGGRDPGVDTHILLYIDGRLEPTTIRAIRAIDTDIRSPGARALNFGRNLGFRGDRSFPDRFFRGWLDEVRVFDAALSPDQVRSLMETNRLP